MGDEEGRTFADKIRLAWQQGGLPKVARMAWDRASYPLRRRWTEGWLARRNLRITIQRRLLGKPVVHAIGDSHTHVLRGVYPFAVTWLGSATAFNLGNPASSTGSADKLAEALGRVDKRRDVVLLALGEIDSRIHVFLQFMRREQRCSFEEIVDEIITRYGEVVLRLKREGYRVVVQSVPATPYQDNIYEVDHYADDETRAEIVRVFNGTLKAWCEGHGIEYLDLYSVVSDKRGFILKELTDDGTHLNAASLPIYRDWVRTIERGSPQ